MVDNKWRFTHRYGCENGLDTSDMETFKKDPYASLAREITQNSIDAAIGDEPVKVEFKLFDIPKTEIPGYQDLEEEINKTWKYVSDSNKDKKPLSFVKKSISADTIKCLRISDFKTKGLVGASTNGRTTPFYNLTKGSGVSDKTGTAGGSKGIGKFATFVASTTNTVFYSTFTEENEQGHIGICKLRSRQVGDDEDLLTEGIGYYADGDRHMPIQESLELDNSFNRTETGTDIFIIGFKDRKGWKDEITAKILESFMVAILKGRLEVVIEDIILNKDTAYSIIFESGAMSSVGKKLRKDIEAQFELLTQGEEKGVFSKELFIDGTNKITVFVKQYSSQESDHATKHCVMVRHPYMKILYTTGHSFLPYSSLCIIHQNELNKSLRAIENPQHTDWEMKRLDEDPEEKKRTKALRKEMDIAIDDFIEEVLQQSRSEKTDLEGAGAFLPAQDDPGDDEEKASSEPNSQEEEIEVTPVKKNKATTPKTAKIGKDGESYEFGEGDEGEGGDGKVPKTPPTPPNPNPNPDHEPKDDDTSGTGDKKILVKTQLSGMKYNIVVTNKNNGRYNVIFTSAYDETNCELSLKQFGADADKYPIDILSASLNGQDCEIEDGKIVRLSIKAGEKYIIECKVNNDSLFAGEVILYAYR